MGQPYIFLDKVEKIPLENETEKFPEGGKIHLKWDRKCEQIINVPFENGTGLHFLATFL